MLKALMLKELRETAWIAMIGLAVHLAFVATCAGYAVLPFWTTRDVQGIPFLDSSFLTSFCFISAGLAAALGMRQTSKETSRGTWLFLLHRPASLWQVLAAKLVVGGGLYLLCGLAAILSYAAWAAMPGKHPSPFLWWMTADAWKAWGLIAIVYLGAFLAGIRPARWFGTRLLPLAATGPLAIALVFALFWPLLGIAAILLAAACLVDGVLRVDCPTDHFKESIRKVVLEFDRPPPEFPACTGLVSNRQVGRKRELIVVGYGEEHRRLAESLGPRAMYVI